MRNSRERRDEVGTGSGYMAALLSRTAREVDSVEKYAQLAPSATHRLDELDYRNVHVRCGDGTLGWPERAPYDAVVAAAGGQSVPSSTG